MYRPTLDDLSETPNDPGPPLTVANIAIHEHDLSEQPQQGALIAAEGSPFISFTESASLSEEQDGTISDDHPYDNSTQGQQNVLSQLLTTKTVHADRVTTSPNLEINPGFGSQRPPFERSSSLEVHASSPTSNEEESEVSALVRFDVVRDSSQDLEAKKAISSAREEHKLPIQSHFAGYSVSEATSESDSQIILTPQTSRTTSRAGSQPSSSLSPAFTPAWPISDAVVFPSSPYLATIQETAFDEQFYPPHPTHEHPTNDYSITQAYGGLGIHRAPSVHTSPIHADSIGEQPRLPHIDPLKYPPCWKTEEGLLIVPSVPGEVPEERTVRCQPQRYNLHGEITSATEKEDQDPPPLKGNDTVDNQVTFAALSPNVMAYRKGKYPQKKRNPSYYDPDILQGRHIHN